MGFRSELCRPRPRKTLEHCRLDRLSESEQLRIEVECLTSRDGAFTSLSDLGESLGRLFSE